MRTAKVYNFGVYSGDLFEIEKYTKYKFAYATGYDGRAVSLTLPVEKKEYLFAGFPPFFEGLLPEGMQLEAILRSHKIDRHDFFSVLLVVGKDMVGSVTVE
ncbi:MAG: HipA N-terminal domain-containing protein [Spirochaetota bacterium]